MGTSTATGHSTSILSRLARASLLGVIGAAAACSGGAGGDDPVGQAPLASSGKARVGATLRALHAKAPAPAAAHRAMPPGLVNARAKMRGGQQIAVVDVLIEGDPASIPALQALGIEVRTVTSAGIMTATLPLGQLDAAAAVAGVQRIDAAKQVKMVNDRANGLVDGAYSYGLDNDRTNDGEGVIVGVIDSGLDWTHEDFIDDDTGQSRILHYWDQSDVTDQEPPPGYTYGREYDRADFDAYNAGDTSAVASYARDDDGHGTHVTGTAAGDGSASGGTYQGGAPAADIVFVKFDFDGDRNSTAAIIDGIDYIFRKAAEAGKPAVINMSLGSDYGPADGSSLEERGLDALADAGRLVVVAAGNPGANNWSEDLAWGYALHGSGELGADPITFRFPANLNDKRDPDYAFFDIWHDGGACTITVSYEGSALCRSSAYNEPGYVGQCRVPGLRQMIVIGQSEDVLGFESDSGSTEVYVELPPATGTWQIDFADCTGPEPSGTYHAKYGASANVVHQWQAESPRHPTPRFGGRESDNAYTIGNPASATEAIAVAAYQSRNQWPYVYGIDNTCDGISEGTQSYGAYPIDYYDPFDLGQLAYFSARGPRRDGVVKPDIAAPGVGIISAFSSHAREPEEAAKCTDYWDGGYYHYGTNRVLPGEQYTVLQGTSMACPAATGAIALLLQDKPDLTAAQLRTLFATTARVDDAVSIYESAPLSSSTDTDADAASLPNADWGYGKLDVVQSLAGLPACAASCLYDSDCVGGGTCVVSSSLGQCSYCEGGCEPTETPDETSCDGVDNDCDGLVDEGLLNGCGTCAVMDDALLGQACGDCGSYACSADGLTILCDDPGANACGDCGPLPAEECNGVDDDCDGDVDEGFGTLTCGTGLCENTIDECVGGVLQSCTPLEAPETTEVSCGDGADNDCDGATDGDDSDCAPACGGNKAPCSTGNDCCSGVCKGGSCRGN